MTFPFLRPAGCLLGLALALNIQPLHATEQQKVLIVVSGEGRDQGRTRPCFEMDEFSQAYLIFRGNGLAVEVASPRGGNAEADKYNPKEAFNAELLEDAEALHKLANTHATAQVNPDDFAAVYVVGGKGAMFDLPADPALRRVISSVYEKGGVVAAVCHGPAALVDVPLSDGSQLISGKRVTGFSNEEEAVFGKRWAKEFPFLLEDAMRARGAQWQEAPLMMPRLVVDGRLITGQNPYSTTAVAEAIVTALGLVPVARQLWRDEATMRLVERLLAGETKAVHDELAADSERFHAELIGLLGYYQLQIAQGDKAIRDALAIMELATPYMQEPQLKLGIADARWRLGDVAEARKLVGKLVETHPDMDEARQLLAKMGD